MQRTLQNLVSGKAPWPLYVWGAAGAGKTYAALWLADRVFESGVWTLEKLADAAFEPDAWSWRRLADKDLHLAVIDEIGLRSQPSDREYLALKKAADLRDWRPCIWISNLGPEELRQQFDDRVASRLLCGSLVEVRGPDQRRIVHGQRT